jgi:hypothetical protein
VNRKIIYVCFGRLTDKMARDWYIDFLIEKGVNVEYWDVVSLLREEHSEGGEQRPRYLRLFRTYDELELALALPENRDALYLILITYVAKFARIFRLLSKRDCRMLYFAWGALPHDPGYRWRKMVAWLSTPGAIVRELLSRSKASALRKLKLVKPFEVAFVAGGALLGGNNHAKRVVPVNYFDYDHYVKTRDAGGARLVAEPYAVFLDINLPHHSDLEFCGRPRIDPTRYYQSLNRLFRLLEAEYRIKVVIAAHPRASHDPATFEGRPTLRLVTADLVKDALFVLSHTSTAMSYAILNAKPLVFVYTDAMAAAYQRSFMREIRTYADYLDAPIYNADEVSSGRQVDIQHVNSRRYERYKYDFLTSRQSEGLSTQDIFWSEISSCGIGVTLPVHGASRPSRA